MPVDNNLKIEKKESVEYPPLPKDIYQVELLDVSSEEKVTYDTRNKPEVEQEKETVLSFQFTLLSGKDGEQNLRGRNVWLNFVPNYLYISSKNGKNKTFRVIEALLSREITLEEEANGITGEMLNQLIGKQCRVSVEPKKSGDKTFDNITDLLKANDLFNALTIEEKEKAKVKKEEKTEDKQEDKQEAPETEVSLEDIPF